jgi:uncharacterized BrkB/YihY/UPF0761 family membrane protein
MHLRFGVQMRFYAFSLLSALFGGAISLRQISLHICPEFPVFGYPVFGLSLYTWAFITFVCCLFVIIVLLFSYAPEEAAPMKLNALEKLAFFAVILLTVANIATTYLQCDLGPCVDLPWPQPQEAPALPPTP